MINTFVVKDAKKSERGFPMDISRLNPEKTFNVRVEYGSNTNAVTSYYEGVRYSELMAIISGNESRGYIQVIGGGE